MMKSKLRDSKTRKVDDRNRSTLGETIKIKKGFIQKTKEGSKRNAALRETGHKFIDVWNIDTGKSTRYLVNPESMREDERVMRYIDRYIDNILGKGTL